VRKTIKLIYDYS